MSAPTILLVGTGRAAFHLGHALRNASVHVVGVVGRDAARTASLASRLGTVPIAPGTDLPKADLVLLAVRDDAIGEVSERLPLSSAVVVHTSGAQPLDGVARHPQHGVLWPVQTLSEGDPMDLGQVPLVIDANNEQARTVIQGIAQRISARVLELAHEQRQRVHLAAVLASNFPVFLVREAQRLLDEQGLPTDLLAPLWSATAANVLSKGPDEALTGPARRGDDKTVQRHLDLLRHDPELRRAYALLSELIQRTYGGDHDRR